MRCSLLVVLLALAPCSRAAEVYRCTAADGTVTLRDVPCHGKEKSAELHNVLPANPPLPPLGPSKQAIQADLNYLAAAERNRLSQRVFLGYRCEPSNGRTYMSQKPCITVRSAPVIGANGYAGTATVTVPERQTEIWSTVGCEEAKTLGHPQVIATYCR